jgi:hypothetical protein
MRRATEPRAAATLSSSTVTPGGSCELDSESGGAGSFGCDGSGRATETMVKTGCARPLATGTIGKIASRLRARAPCAPCR